MLLALVGFMVAFQAQTPPFQPELWALTAPGALPGGVIAYRPSAFVVAGIESGGIQTPLVAASEIRNGRAMVIGHEAFWSHQANSKFFAESLAWLAKGRKRVGLIGIQANESLAVAGFKFTIVDSKTTKGQDVLVINQGALDGDLAGVQAIKKFVQSGGGLLMMGPAWGWQQLNPAKLLKVHHSGQQILAFMGLGWSESTIEGDHGMFKLEKPRKYSSAWNSLIDIYSKTKFSDRDVKQVASSLENAFSSIPDNEPYALDLKNTIETPAKDLTPQARDILKRLAAIKFDRDWRKCTPEQIKAYADSTDFPGSVDTSAKHEIAEVQFTPQKRRWISTGRYAAPGEVITAIISPDWVGKVGLRIGGHSDTLWHMDKWERFPSITNEQPFAKQELKLANPFGGLVYLVQYKDLGQGTLELRDTVAAPTYILGTTSDNDWASIRQSPGPWGEIVGRQTTVCVPAAVLKTLDNPRAVAEYWDEVVQLCEKFYAVPAGSHEERYQADRQISAGYMHSGYPIMTGPDVASKFVNLKILRGKDGNALWGFYHEMGHNFQKGAWTWDVWGETTNNLFSLYANETINGDLSGSHPAMKEAEVQKRWLEVSTNKGAKEYYGLDPWYGLTLLVLIKNEFGWEPFTKLFGEFEKENPQQLPHNEQEKRDQFCLRLSKLLKRNLSPYFKAWGVKLTENTEQQLGDLPTWFPRS